jgi:SepF-like predicted cell division protein (DUF552 family)
MKMFEMLDKLHEKNKMEEPPVNIPKTAIEKYTDVKEYKRQYYLRNYLIYKERNRLYRESKKVNRNDPDDQSV